MKRSALPGLLLLLAMCCQMAVGQTLVRDGKSDYVIVLPNAAADAETTAARELQDHLAQVTGAKLPIRPEGQVSRETPQIVLGSAARIKELAPDLNAAALGHDGIVIRSVGKDLILTGRPPRGTLYAVYTFLEDVVGCRWWTSTESFIPKRATLEIGAQSVTQTPRLRYREAFYRDAFAATFAARLKLNGHHHRIPAELGGHYSFAGFVHTFYPLVPPAKYFAAHPEWYSEIRGKRTAEHAQLCLTNDEMRKELTKNALALLRKTPNAGLISISQNDWHGRCECAKCKAIEDEEGSPAGLLVRFVNAVAEDIEKAFPDVLVETLAYQYTREPPRLVKPRKNVVIRLCSIECSFVQPLSGPQNEKFRKDIEGWSRIAPQLFIWDYVTNFSNYILPHANMRVLAPNVRFFVDHRTIGLFEQGDAGSSVGDFVRLRAWLLAHLMWNPQADEKALIREFLGGYYGPAAPHLAAYLDAIHDAAEGSKVYLRCFMHDTSGWLSLDDLNRASRLFDQAQAAVANDPTLSARVRRERLPLDHVWLQRYHGLKRLARAKGVEFLGPKDPVAAAAEYVRLAKEWKVGQYAEGRPFAEYAESLMRSFRPAGPPPEQCKGLPEDDWIDVQDNQFRLARPGHWAKIADDPQASDGKAVRMPGSHFEWATSWPVSDDVAIGNPWHCYLVARCDAKAAKGPAMTMGIYDSQAKRGVVHRAAKIEELAGKPGYQVFDLGMHKLASGMYFWVAPPKRPDDVTAVWVDRIFLVRERAKNEKKPDPTIIRSAAQLKERMKTELQVTRPDYVVFQPQVSDERVSDTGNEHFLVFDGPDGSLMAVWTQSTAEAAPDQHIVFVQSKDEGRTWTQPRIIAGPARPGQGLMASWAFPLVSRSGRIYVLYSQSVGKFDTFPHTTGRLDGIFSDDNGRTWSQPQTVHVPRTSRDNPDSSFPPNWICWQKPLRLTKDGRYLAGVTRWTSLAVKKNPTPSWISHDSVVEFIRFDNVDDNPDVSALKLTWLAWDRAAITVPFPGHPEVSVCQEPSIVKLPDGRLFCVMRTSAGSPFWTQSSDDGQTWSPSQRLLRQDDGEPLLHPLSPCPIYDVGGNTAGSGRYALFVHNHDGHYQGAGPADTSLHRRPVYLAAGRFQPGAKQPVWFDEPRYFMDHRGVGLGQIGTRGRLDLALYASMTVRNNQAVLWYPDRKFFLLGREIGPQWFQPRQTPGVRQETREERDARMKWWREARFGMFIHWGLYAQLAGEYKGQRMPEIGEWIMSKYRIPIAEYSQLAKQFNPVKFDADAWVRVAKRAGMRYMIITSKHHDGFAMFHSASDPYNIQDATPFGRDPIKELAAACQKHGLKFGVYYSQALDWHERDAGGTEPWLHLNAGNMSWGNAWDFPDYAQKRFDRYFEKKVKPQLRELLTGYGPLGAIWFDTPFTISREQSEELYNLVRSLQPGCIMNSRLGNGLGDYQSAGDNRIPSRGVLRDWETPATINKTWGYKSFDHDWKTVDTLVRNLVDIASKNGNYLLNVGPTAQGEIPAPSIERLEEVGRWLDVNGAAIYGTTGSPLDKPPAWGRCTQKPGKLYLHVFDWPKDGRLVVPLAKRPSKVRLLARPNETLPFSVQADSLTISVPTAAPDSRVSVVEVEY